MGVPITYTIKGLYVRIKKITIKKIVHMQYNLPAGTISVSWKSFI